jgi:hypothetical protein
MEKGLRFVVVISWLKQYFVFLRGCEFFLLFIVLEGYSSLSNVSFWLRGKALLCQGKSDTKTGKEGTASVLLHMIINTIQ